MKTDSLLIKIQFLTILPTIFFLSIYNKDASILTTFLLIALLLILGLNVKNYWNKKPIINYPTLLLLLLSYFLFAFNLLGSSKTPITYNVFNKQNPIASMQLNKTENIDEVCYYFGINKNVKFYLEYKNHNKWTKFYSHKENFPFSFQWSCNEINTTKIEKVQLIVTKGQMMLSELRFRKDGRDVNFTSNKSKIYDEREIEVKTDYYNGMFFDEIYHGRTAYEIMRDIPVYENTHPYLGKILIIPGIKLFGMTPFGWRFTNVIFGALFIVVAYFLGLQLFKKQIYGFITSFLMTYSFMHLTEARMALIDTFGVLFVFSSYLFLYYFIIKQKLRWLLLSGLFFGLASAVKWSAVFAALGFMLIALYLLISKYPMKKKFSGYKLILYGLLSYGFLALTVYTLTFYDIYLKTGSFQSIIEYQVNMYNYHSNITSSHPYSSEWWSWPFDVKPMCATREITNGQFSSVTIFGNPAIFWLGVVSILYLVYVLIRKRTMEASFILLAFIGLYLPYMFIGRYMFIYHYYYAVPFLILAIVYGIKDFLSYYPKYSILVWIYLSLVAGLFLAFYPVISGYEVAKSYVDNYLIWFPGWWL